MKEKTLSEVRETRWYYRDNELSRGGEKNWEKTEIFLDQDSVETLRIFISVRHSLRSNFEELFYP